MWASILLHHLLDAGCRLVVARLAVVDVANPLVGRREVVNVLEINIDVETERAGRIRWRAKLRDHAIEDAVELIMEEALAVGVRLHVGDDLALGLGCLDHLHPSILLVDHIPILLVAHHRRQLLVKPLRPVGLLTHVARRRSALGRRERQP